MEIYTRANGYKWRVHFTVNVLGIDCRDRVSFCSEASADKWIEIMKNHENRKDFVKSEIK